MGSAETKTDFLDSDFMFVLSFLTETLELELELLKPKLSLQTLFQHVDKDQVEWVSYYF